MEEQAEALAGQWYDAFAENARFEALTELQRDEAGAVVEFLAKYSSMYLAVQPGEWTRHSVVTCATDILPRKVSARAEFFGTIAPVLEAFFMFLHKKGLVENGRAIATAVSRAHDEILRNAADKRNWGPAKSLVMSAIEAGVDLEDDNALQAYIQEYNQRLRASFGGLPAKPSKPVVERPSNRYAPCPCGSGKKFKFCCERKD